MCLATRCAGTVGFYDEFVHGLISFCLALLAWAAYQRGDGRGPGLLAFLALVGAALTAGLLWEFVEAGLAIIGTRRDTLIDLAMDAFGTADAGAFALWSKADTTLMAGMGRKRT